MGVRLVFSNFISCSMLKSKFLLENFWKLKFIKPTYLPMMKDPRFLSRDAMKHTFRPVGRAPAIEWRVESGLIDYPEALFFMEERVKDIHKGTASEMVWLVEHPPIYTAGTSAEEKDLLVYGRFPVYKTGRGGKFTYHGPGQRIAYVMLDLKHRKQDVRAFVAALEEWGIHALEHFNIKGERREDRVGIWVTRSEKSNQSNGLPAEDKIAAIGIRLRKWISSHGIAINVNPHLEHYSSIIPCGIAKYGVTSFFDLGVPITMEDIDSALATTFHNIFGQLR
ncbi:MAG: lipoyl(octanoyl) transferase [Candidatus Tokpelaia sp. JSC188]|nr:MAG: lipoyl(octanoyl) transferase [Candidatus Tokpelaia sp. JSC188]